MRTTVAPQAPLPAAVVQDDVLAAGCQTLLDVFRFRAEQRGDRLAYRFLPGPDLPEAVITYDGLDRRARAIAVRIREHARAGDRAILLFAPGLDYIAAFVGCLYAGVIAVPAYPPHPRRPDERVPGIVGDCGAVIALTTHASSVRLERWRADEPTMRNVHWIATDTLSDDDGGQWTVPASTGGSIAMLQYTSGSTAAPRGVILAHENLMSNLRVVHRSFAHREDDDGVFWLPPFHDMGLIGAILQAAYVGLSTALMPPATFLQRPMAWLEAIARFRATTSGAPNFAYDLCVDRSTPEERAALDLSRWRTAFNGAEPIRAETIDRFARAFECAGFRREAFLPCYGLAEATLMVTGGPFEEAPVVASVSRSALAGGRLVSPSDDGDEMALVSSGTVIAEHDVRIVDPESSTVCDDGMVGEIWVAGPSVGRGYWGRGDDAMFGARLADDPRRWLRTGDLGALRDGHLFVTGRRKDLIIIGGRNFHANDVERVAERSHPELRPGHAAAFSVTSEGREALVIALEVSRHADTSGHREAIAAVRRAIADNLGVVAHEVVLVRQGTIPRTSSGKIRRSATREALLDGSLDVIAREGQVALELAAAELRPNAKEWLVSWLSTELNRTPDELELDVPFRELGLESLDVVRLVVAIERELSVPLDASTLWEAGNIRNAVALIEGNGREQRPAAIADTDIHALDARLEALEASGYADPYFVVHDGVSSDTTRIATRTLLSFGSYNYLGLAGHPAVRAAAIDAIERLGTSVSASRLVSGERQLHRELEAEIASFLGAEQALTFVSGHATNVSTIPRLVSSGDLIVADALAHDSIVQGARLSGARRLVFPHNDWEALDAMLRDLRADYRRALVVIEGVYSADGDIPDLARFVEIKQRHRTLLMVDEAHSVGVLGASGRGITEHAGIDPSAIDVHMGTLSKALASCGGYIAGSAELVRRLRYSAAGFVFSVGMTPANTAAALAALRTLRDEPARVTRLRENAALFLKLVHELGANTGGSAGTPIVPVVVGDSFRAVRVAHRLSESGVSAPPMVSPSVPEGQARLRFFVTAEHSEPQLREAARALSDALRESDA